MRYAFALPAFAALAFAAPAPQGIDLSAVETAAPALIQGPPITAASQAPTSVYNAASVVASVAAAVSTAPVDPVVKRQIDVNAACAPQPDGYGPVASPNTDSGFLAYQPFADAANSATAPAPYTLSFKNLQGSTSMNTYMGLYTLKTYSASQCAALCDQAQGCLGINLYFERDPTINPATACPNPTAFTNVKCTLWGSAVTAASATNQGQWRGPMDSTGAAFHVVIAGSNGWSKPAPPPTQTGFTGPTALAGAINATTKHNPVTGNEDNIYIGTKFYNQPYDASVCAALCKSTTADNRAQALANYNKKGSNSDGTYQACNFYDAYLLSKNGVPQGLYCALYTAVVDKSYATVTGTTQGNNVYTVSNSYSYSLTAPDNGTVATA